MQIDLEHLLVVGKPELRDIWEKRFGTAPPPRLDVRFMRLALGWHLQATGGNGFDRDTRQQIDTLKQRLVAGMGALAKEDPRKRNLSLGVTLIREWHGTVHKVQVVEQGYVWNNRVWNSLSAIAREITGVRWIEIEEASDSI